MNRINRKNKEKQKHMRHAAEACIHRHLFHLMPPQGWMNDPNGFVHFNGAYHLFYQHNPYTPQWGLMHWGHSRSTDLVTWQHLPLALKPDQPYDSSGCFSGSSIVHNGKLYVFYTGIDRVGRQTQCLAISRDGLSFQKHPGNPVIPAPPDTIDPKQFRDPCVFRRAGRYYMVVGAESLTHQGQVIVYVSDTLIDWAYLNTIHVPDLGYMWECPSLLFLDSTAVLILSPQGIQNRPPFDNEHDSGYFIGNFDTDTGAFKHGAFQKLDFGFDFYAPQAITDSAGRSLMTAWMSSWNTPSPTAECGWAGSMILPRKLYLSGGRLKFRPIPEIADSLKQVITVNNVPCNALLPLQCSAGRLYMEAEDADFAIHLFCSADDTEYTLLSYEAQTATVSLDLSHSGESARGSKSVSLVSSSEPIRLDIYLDRSSVEVFINDGRLVMSARVFPHRDADGIRFSGEAMMRSVSYWEFIPSV